MLSLNFDNNKIPFCPTNAFLISSGFKLFKLIIPDFVETSFNLISVNEFSIFEFCLNSESTEFLNFESPIKL